MKHLVKTFLVVMLLFIGMEKNSDDSSSNTSPATQMMGNLLV